MDTSIHGLITLIVWLLLGCLAWWLAMYIVSKLELQAPVRQVVLILVALVAILAILWKMGIVSY